jgi:hypothetical protein
VRYDSVSGRPGPDPRPEPAPAGAPVLAALAPLGLSRPAPLVLRGRRFDAASPAVMAIVNRTRDSFFSGNRHDDLEAAKAALSDAVECGADMVDIGVYLIVIGMMLDIVRSLGTGIDRQIADERQDERQDEQEVARS